MKRKITAQKRIHFDQSGVIPYRKKDGKTEVLLVTSIRRKNWIVPKGFIEYNMSPFQSAKKEAFEEAGVKGSNTTKILGSYKVKKNGSELLTKIYSMKVTRVFKDYPEKISERENGFQFMTQQRKLKLLSLQRL
ncbi:MAG: NUDIX hydrolase [Ignavibacteriaceae bacterium]|nr:NUDIX hydrolase [Ignavibacteriaceae bacterium]